MLTTKAPPLTIRYQGLTLTLYDSEPLWISGRAYYTYYLRFDSRLWEYCPETGRCVQTN